MIKSVNNLERSPSVIFSVFLRHNLFSLRLASHLAGGRKRNGVSRWVVENLFLMMQQGFVARNSICSYTKQEIWFKPVVLNEGAMGTFNHNRRSADRLFVESNCIS